MTNRYFRIGLVKRFVSVQFGSRKVGFLTNHRFVTWQFCSIRFQSVRLVCRTKLNVFSRFWTGSPLLLSSKTCKTSGDPNKAEKCNHYILSCTFRGNPLYLPTTFVFTRRRSLFSSVIINFFSRIIGLRMKWFGLFCGSIGTVGGKIKL